MRNLKKDKQQSFMGNVLIVLIAQFTVKVLGMVYRMVITNIEGFGDSGNGFYTAGFNVYTVLLAISAVGIPNAIAKLVAEKAALQDYRGAHKIFTTAMKLFAIIGLCASALLFFGADFYANVLIEMPGAQYVIKALSPSIFFVCVSSVVRGYFQGLHNMNATSRSQILEQVFKCSLTILLVVLAMGQPPEIMAAWANAASSIACLLSFGYLIFFYMRRQSGIMEQIRQTNVECAAKSTKTLIKSILMLSIPISLASIITSINRVIDTATISRGIQAAFQNAIPAYMGHNGLVAAITSPTSKQLYDEAMRLSGMLSKSDTLINMPLAVNFAFATVLVPAISSALASGNKKEASDKTSYSFLISLLLILPCAIGYIVLAKPIYQIIYPAAPLGHELLAMTAISMIFSALNQTIAGALQGIGKVYVPAIGLLVGCVIKVILNILLIRIPSINITGAVISTIACQFAAFAISFAAISKYITIKVTISKFIAKPLISGGIMAIAAYGVYRAIISLILPSYIGNLIATLSSIAAAAIIYFAMVFATKILTKEEIMLMPMGTKIYSLLCKLRFYK